MSNNGSNARPRRARMRNAVPTAVLAAAALALGAAPAGAHGGDTALVHSCIDNGGNVKIIAAHESCKTNEVALDWARDGGAGGGTTYTAGTGLTLSANEFSVKDVPWSHLIDIPDDLADGDDDGSAAVGVLRSELAHDDGAPNGDFDPISFSKIKDLVSVSGNGRITGDFIRDESVEGHDIRNGTITASDLAGSDAPGEIVVGAVTSEKIMDGTIQARDLASGVLDPIVTMTTLGLQVIPAGDRAAVEVPLDGVNPRDLVVVSPPPSLDDGLVFAGSDVRQAGTVTLYLHNITAEPISLGNETWTIRRLPTSG